MILTKKQAFNEIALLRAETFSKECEDEARKYRESLPEGRPEERYKKNEKIIPTIAPDIYKITDAAETWAYTDSLPVELKSALIDRFNLFLDELQNQKYKKIELPYSRNNRLKLILVDFSFGSSSIAVKNRN